MIFVIIQYFFVFLLLTNAEQDQHLCSVTETYTEFTNVVHQESYIGVERVWCKKFPFRCDEPVVRYRDVTHTYPVIKTRTALKCCEGYHKSSQNICVPICVEDCGPYGTCTSPDRCMCKPGYSGDTCNVCIECGDHCQAGFWGTHCNNTCSCQNNSTCNRQNGECVCAPGWQGLLCSELCADGYFGKNCSDKCLEKDLCDHVTGNTTCRPGFKGNRCNSPCPISTWGIECNGTCRCKNNGTCAPDTGQCTCAGGWTGEECEKPCPEGYYGPNCAHRCLCANKSLCRATDGFCICSSGYRGKHCTDECPYGYYGEHCVKPCVCASERFICSPTDGCTCPGNWTGENCDVSMLRMPDPPEAETENATGAILITLCVLITLIGIVLAVFAVIYFKKYRRIRDDLRVQYTAYPTIQARTLDPTLNNSSLIINDLGNRRVTTPSTASSSALPKTDEPEYEDFLTKNLNADKTNPNLNIQNNQLYMDMDKISEEDEVKYENINYNNPTKTDHLD